MNPSVAKSAVLWTGGKDSVLALHEAQMAGYRVRYLITFAPPEPDFLAHPVGVMKLQAEALALPHFLWPVREPFAESYEVGLRWMKETLHIDTAITGDIAEVGANPHWIRERSRPIDMNVLTPLWERDRLTLLQQLLAAKFKVVFSCVRKRWLSAGWAGRELNDETVAELRALREQTGLDLCGEQGEYHTLVTDAPEFRRRLHLGAFHVRERENLAHVVIEHAELKDKP